MYETRNETANPARILVLARSNLVGLHGLTYRSTGHATSATF